MVTADHARTVQLWSITDSRHPALLATLPADVQPRAPITLSRDGRTLVTAAAGNSLRLWDVRDPRVPVARGVLTGHTDLVYSTEMTPDGHTLITAGRDHTLRTWDISDPAAPRALAKLGGTMTDQLDVGTLTSDGRTLVTVGGDKRARLWDFADPAHPGLLSTTPHPDLLTWAVFSPDRRTLATASWDSVVRLWDVTDPHAPRPLSSRSAGPGVVWSIAFSPDGRMLATTSDDKQVHLWDVTTPAAPEQLAQLSGSITPLAWVAFTPDGRTVLTAGDDRSVRLHDLAEFGPALRAQTVARTYTPDGRTLITSGSDVRLWAADGTRPPRELGVIEGFPGWITALALSPDGRSLATAALSGGAGGQSVIQRWDITDPARPKLTATVTTKPAYSFAFSPDGRRLAVGYDDGPTEIWDVSDRTRFAAPVTVPSDAGTIWAVVFTPDGRSLITARGGDHPYVRLWDVSGPRPAALSTLTGGTGGFVSLALAADGRTLAAGSSDWNTYLWDIGDLLHPAPLPRLSGQTDKIAALSFAGRTLVTASFGSAWLWDLTDPGSPAVKARLALPDSVNSAVFSPDGHTLATGSRTVQLWETDLDRAAQDVCSVATPRITQAEWDSYLPGVPFAPPCP
jgi:WD40 repeat protein